MQFSEIMKLPYYEYEYILEDIKDIEEKEAKQQEEQNSYPGFKLPDAKQYMNQVQQSLPKISIPKL